MAMMEEKETFVVLLHQASSINSCKTVIKWSGFFAPSKLIFAPGAFLAAQPHTEFNY
jgi:hypothetical protein